MDLSIASTYQFLCLLPWPILSYLRNQDIGTPLIDSPSPFTRSESVIPLFPDQSDASSLGEQASQPVTIDDLPKIRIRGEDYVDH